MFPIEDKKAPEKGYSIFTEIRDTLASLEPGSSRSFLVPVKSKAEAIKIRSGTSASFRAHNLYAITRSEYDQSEGAPPHRIIGIRFWRKSPPPGVE